MKLKERLSRWFLIDLVANIYWPNKSTLTEEDKHVIYDMLAKDYYVIVTRRSNYLSTYLTALGHFLLTGKWGYWSHALMNLEDQVHSPNDFKLVEAIKEGVSISPFERVFNCNSVALLKPKHMTISAWTEAMDGAKSYVGTPYDTLFDLAHDNEMSCVELVLNSIKKIPNHEACFPNFEAMIAKEGNLTPQMYYDSEDFEVAFEVRR